MKGSRDEIPCRGLGRVAPRLFEPMRLQQNTSLVPLVVLRQENLNDRDVDSVAARI